MHEKIGLLGGSFNPIHYGHLKMAETAKQVLKLDRLLIIPDGDPPHKAKELADKRHRLKMTELAAAGKFEVSAMEVERPGKTYTVDTLEALHVINPDAELYMIIGADTLYQLHTWRNAHRVFELCRFAVFPRDEMPIIGVLGANVVEIAVRVPDISATEVRKRVHKGLSLSHYVPQAVEDYIGLHRLYDPPMQMKEKAIRKRLQETLPPQRYRHITGVESTMQRLGEQVGYKDKEKLMLTGLLHDCAKGMALEEMRKFVIRQGIDVDAMQWSSVALLHAVAGAEMARSVYGVTNPDILHAIRYHNTGTSPAPMLDKILWVADMMEPNRKDYDWMAGFRALAEKDVSEAAVETLRRKIAYLKQKNKQLHPDTEAALAALLKEKREREETA